MQLNPYNVFVRVLTTSSMNVIMEDRAKPETKTTQLIVRKISSASLPNVQCVIGPELGQ